MVLDTSIEIMKVYEKSKKVSTLDVEISDISSRH